jgi:L-alanine-DL-glutamate epimerase-like enolase superfamily enzyme
LPAVRLSVHGEYWPAITPFRITGKTFDGFESVVVELAQAGLLGRGEGLGVHYLGETVHQMLTQVSALAPALEAGLSRSGLQTLLPPGGARNALDAALWDLEAKSNGQRVWQLCGVEPRTLETVFSIGIEATPQAMADKAAAATTHGLLKIKLDSDAPVARVQAIRAARPDARLVVDANQGWTFAQLQAVAPALADLGVQMIEQPLPRGADAALQGYRSPVPLYADESCQHLGELDLAAQRYQGINIKLDKTGGLTEALALAKAAQERGLSLMVGCMAGTSLSMAPAFVIGQMCSFVDLDGPLLMASDRDPGMTYLNDEVLPPRPDLWG